MSMRLRDIRPVMIPAGFAMASIVLLACGDAPRDDGAGSRDRAIVTDGATRAGPGDGAIPDRFGYGRPATAAEIAALDIDVTPDGAGLPPGRGTVQAGAAVYAAQCAICHGAAGEGVPGVGNQLVGRAAIDSTGWNRTIGNYWPFAPTIFDYIRRTMPFDRPGSLADEQVYGLTAYLLHLNEIIPADAVMDARTLPQVVMPARDRFVPDDREASTVVR